MKAGDILLFVGGKDFIDEEITKETHSEYAHAAIAISETEYIEAWWSGVRKTTLNPNDPRQIDIYVPITPLTDSQKAQIVGFAISKIGEGYNFLELAGFEIEGMFHTNKNIFRSTHRVICSQLVIECYKSIGIDLLPNIEEFSTEPGNISESKLLMKGA